MRLFLGVDGGQSATKAVVGDAVGRILGRGRAGPCNHVRGGNGRAKLERAVGDAVGQALGAAGVRGDSRFEAACFGMSGGPADKLEILTAQIPTERIEVTTDAHIALEGALGGKPGVVMIAGTGSMALARDAQGRTVRAGGWGYVLGDEGGAFDTVRQALRAALRMEEGWGGATALREALLRETGAADANELMHWFYTEQWPRSRVAALLPVVARVAEGEDDGARSVLAGSARRLAVYALSARHQLFTPGERPAASYVGGVFEIPAVLAEFRRILSASCEVAAPLFGPELGALLGAYRVGGLRVELQTE